MLEAFLGVEVGEFTVRVTSDVFLGDVPAGVPPFAEGETWLVEAYRHQPDFQWTTSTCERTKPIQQAEEDLRVLRAWVAGQRLPAWVAGEVWNSAERKASVRVYLRGEKQTLSAITDERGRFSFENLEPGVYEAFAVAPGGESPVKIDLTKAWCSGVVLAVKP